MHDFYIFKNLLCEPIRNKNNEKRFYDRTLWVVEIYYCPSVLHDTSMYVRKRFKDYYPDETIYQKSISDNYDVFNFH